MSSIQPAANEHALGEMASAYLDALRAIGANLVIAGHVSALYFGTPRDWLGPLGVTIFFLLSGFLIMQSMLNWLHRPEPRLPGFLADRVARIMTPYVPALVIIAVVEAVLVTGNHGLGGHNTGFVMFLGNLLLLQDHSLFQFLEMGRINFDGRIRAYNTAEPFWTVAVEMWIYVAVGLFFFCLIAREKIDRRYAAGLLAVSVPVIIWNAAAGGGKSLTLIWLLGAMAGFLFHLWRGNAFANLRSIGAVIAAVGLVALLGRAGKVGFQPYDFQTATLMAMIMFGALALLISIKRAPASLKRPAVFLASYSYSLYLVHNTVLIAALQNIRIENMWTKVALAALLAHVCAYAHYLAFERHYRDVARWLRPRFAQALAPREQTSAAVSAPQTISLSQPPSQAS